MTHIVYGIDDKYLPCLLVSMYSLLKMASGPLKITVLVAEPEVEDASDIHKMADHFPNLTVDVRRFETGNLEEYEKSVIAARFPAASMIPLFIPWLIDGKCLFLDADTLILHDISELYHTDLNGCLIGACLASTVSISHQKYFLSILKTLSFQRGRRRRTEFLEVANRVGFSIQEMAMKYFSSGVILMDSEAIRKADPSGDLMNINAAREHWGFWPRYGDLQRVLQGPDSLPRLEVERSSGLPPVQPAVRTASIVGGGYPGSQGPWRVALFEHIWAPILEKVLVQDPKEIPHLSAGLPGAGRGDGDPDISVVRCEGRRTCRVQQVIILEAEFAVRSRSGFLRLVSRGYQALNPPSTLTSWPVM